MPCCTIFYDSLHLLVLAGRHPVYYVGLLIASRIIYPAALCLIIIILLTIWWLQPYSMWQVPSSFWQMGQIGEPSIWLHWAARIWLYIKSVRQSMTFFFSPEAAFAIFQNELLMSFLHKAFLVQFLVFCSDLWTDGLKPFLIQDLICVGRAYVLVQHWDLRKWRAFLLEDLVGRC